MQIQEIAIEKIRPNPFQPRSNYEDDQLEELTESVKVYGGLIQPITVRKSDCFYEIAAGHRRWQACKRLGYDKIPAIVEELTDEQMLETALLENLQRRDLNPIEEALAYAKLRDKFKWSQTQTASRIGKTRDYVAQRLRLLALSKKIQELVSHDTINTSVAEAIASTPPRIQNKIVSKIEAGWKPTVAQIGEFRRFTPKDTQEKAKPERELLARVERLEQEIALTQWPLLANGLLLCPHCFATNLKPRTVLIDEVPWIEYACEQCGIKVNTKELDDEKPFYSEIFKIAEEYEGRDLN